MASVKPSGLITLEGIRVQGGFLLWDASLD